MEWFRMKMACCLCSRRSARDIREAQMRKEKKRLNDQIEKELKADAKRRRREHRILLLGCGEAGKSTFIKQMRIINSEGFTDEERLHVKSDIADNIVTAIKTLLQNTRSHWADPEMESLVTAVEGIPPRPTPEEVLEHAEKIQILWQTPQVQEAYENRSTFQIVDNAKYFLGKVQEVMQADYLPTNQDIVQTRVKTTGIIEHEFEINDTGHKKKKLILIDVGGQRSERKKWIHCFQDVMLLLFLTAINEFDQVLAEDETTNRLQESICLFQFILNNRWFTNTNVIIFLNKIDLLKEKIKKKSLKEYFPEYSGADDDAEGVIDFFSNLFFSLNPNPEERKIYAQPTCATDTESIKVVDVIIKETILGSNLRDVYIN